VRLLTGYVLDSNCGGLPLDGLPHLDVDGDGDGALDLQVSAFCPRTAGFCAGVLAYR
jgi:hypothetical protein